MSERVTAANRPIWLFSLPWEPDAIGGVSQVVHHLIENARADDRPLRPFLLIPDYDARTPSVARRHGTVTLRTRVLAPVLSGGSVRQWAALLLKWPASAWRLWQLLRRVRPAGVNVHYPGLWCVTLMWALRAAHPRARLVLSFHGADVQQIDAADPITRWWWLHLLRGADAVTCCSANLSTRLATALRGHTPRAVVVHNGIDAAALEANARRGRMLEALEGQRYVLNLATFEDKKGQDVLVRAFAGLSERQLGLRLVIAGRQGPALGPLRNLVHELGIADKVHLLMDLPHADAMALLRSAAVFALSSRQEPFGIVLLEAAHFGVPIVASAVGGVPEFMSHEQTALLVPPDQPAALAAALQRILENDELRRRLEADAQTHVASFTWHAAFERYRSLVMEGH